MHASVPVEDIVGLYPPVALHRYWAEAVGEKGTGNEELQHDAKHDRQILRPLTPSSAQETSSQGSNPLPPLFTVAAIPIATVTPHSASDEVNSAAIDIYKNTSAPLPDESSASETFIPHGPSLPSPWAPPDALTAVLKMGSCKVRGRYYFRQYICRLYSDLIFMPPLQSMLIIRQPLPQASSAVGPADDDDEFGWYSDEPSNLITADASPSFTPDLYVNLFFKCMHGW